MDEELTNRERIPLVDEGNVGSTVYSVEDIKAPPPSPIFQRQQDFDNQFAFINIQEPSLTERLKKAKDKFSFKKFLCVIFPILDWFPNYNWHTDMLHDIMAGFTISVLHIPQGLAYSTLAGVPSIVGIYMAFFPVLIYAIMGTSRHISMGTFAVICMMASKSVTLYAVDGYNGKGITNATNTTGADNNLYVEPYSPIEVVCALSLAVGAWQLLLGTVRLGSLYVLLSENLVSGLITGAAISVIVSQIKNALGLKLKPHVGTLKVVYTLIEAVEKYSMVNYVSLSITLSVVFFLTLYNRVLKVLLKKHFHIVLPMELLIIISSTLVSKFVNFEQTFNVSTVGSIPIGFPPARIPPLELVPTLILDGFVIAIVSFAVNISMATLFAEKHRYDVDANQELVAAGSANIFGSFFSCAPFSASLTRSLVQEMSGGRTQLASIISCICLTSILLFIGPFFEPLPNCILAAIILVAMQGILSNALILPIIWHQSKFNGFLWVATFLSVVLVDIDIGLTVGVAISLLQIILLGQKIGVDELGNLPNTDLYVVMKHYRKAVKIPGLLILRVIGGMNFANKDNICNRIYKKAEKYADEKTMHVILDFTSIIYIDPPAVKNLIRVYDNLTDRGITLRLCNSSPEVIKTLIRCNFFNTFPEFQLFPSVQDAVLQVEENHR